MLSTRAALGIALGVPLLTGFNRVYVREHWATDVLGGWLLGGAVGLACAVLGARGAGVRTG
jgi:undecaprenyl-diphosphatase